MPAMEESYKSAEKILGEAKLSRDNYESFFQALDFWATMRRLKWIYDNKKKYQVKRNSSKDTDELKMSNAIMMTLLMNQLNGEDLGLISGLSKISEVVKKLKKKYHEKRPARVKQDIAKFYTNRLGKDETIMQT